MNLKEIALEINVELQKRREELELTFIEDTHTYFMKDLDGTVKTHFPSVSAIYKKFYKPFDTDGKSLAMAQGDVVKQQLLLKEWKDKGTRSTNLGSRVHFHLEEDLVEQYGDYKDLRYPIFHCGVEDTKSGDNMIKAGKEYIDLMHERGAVSLDTEIIMGDPELGYTGQVDNAWIMLNQKGELGIVETDWKTNQPKNFVKQRYNTDYMYRPFDKYINIALSHYYLQIPLYARLLLKMLQNSKFKDIKFFGGVVVLLKKDGTFEEFKVPKDVINSVFKLNIQEYVKQD